MLKHSIKRCVCKRQPKCMFRAGTKTVNDSEYGRSRPVSEVVAAGLGACCFLCWLIDRKTHVPPVTAQHLRLFPLLICHSSSSSRDGWRACSPSEPLDHAHFCTGFYSLPRRWVWLSLDDSDDGNWIAQQSLAYPKLKDVIWNRTFIKRFMISMFTNCSIEFHNCELVVKMQNMTFRSLSVLNSRLCQQISCCSFSIVFFQLSHFNANAGYDRNPEI